MKFEDILAKVVPNFNSDEYNYDYWEGDFQYYHNTNEEFINGEFEGIEILDTLCVDSSYGEDWFVIFKFEDRIYKVEYQEGSQGMNYKILEDTLKEVQAKVKEVTYYE